MKRYLIIVGIVVLGLYIWYYLNHPLGVRIIIRGHEFPVEIAATESEKMKGLGGRSSMPEDHGMLFAYRERNHYSFWMKDMQFPLDIVWVDDKTIIEIHKNVPIPSGESLPSYRPQQPVDNVLELNAGTTDKYRIQVGDTIKILTR